MNSEISFLKDAWTVETRDLTSEIRNRISPNQAADSVELILLELRKVSREVAQLRETTFLLQTEVFRLRGQLASRPVPLISPYTAPDSRVRLS